MPKNAINQKKSIFSKSHDEKTFLGINCCSTYKNLSNDTKVGRGYHTCIYNFIWERWLETGKGDIELGQLYPEIWKKKSEKNQTLERDRLTPMCTRFIVTQ